MNAWLAKQLVDPKGRLPFKVEPAETAGEEIIRGHLCARDGVRYPIRGGIPRLVITEDADEVQTSSAFDFKWKKRESYSSQAFQDLYQDWLCEKYGFASVAAWSKYFSGRQAILDLGCGSGLASAPWLKSPAWTGQARWVGVDITEAVDVAAERLGHLPHTHFVQANALKLPFRDGAFDAILSEGVLHHTKSTRAALLAASRVLAPGGEFHFYVYRRKGPVREFTDDYIRQQIAPLSEAEAWEAMRSLTHLGQALAQLQVTVTLEQDIPLLGIKAGQHDIQRLIYWNFAKLYWNEAFSFEENLHINFDWYRPRFAYRQTAQEVRSWCAEAGLTITWFHEQESGFTVRATKI
jgi:arsenite methyltransferase